jgi:hypothetical protein
VVRTVEIWDRLKLVEGKQGARNVLDSEDSEERFLVIDVEREHASLNDSSPMAVG